MYNVCINLFNFRYIQKIENRKRGGKKLRVIE